MKTFPSIAIVEFNSIADGIYVTDAILKKAPIAMIKSGTVSGGRYLTIFGGTTGSTSESLTEALMVGNGTILDHVFLPDVHDQIHNAILGERAGGARESIAVLETDTISANVRATESALKGTGVTLVELRLAEYEMSGKAISVFNGELHEIEAAMQLAGGHHRIIARPHETLAAQLDHTTRYADAKPHSLPGEEAS